MTLPVTLVCTCWPVLSSDSAHSVWGELAGCRVGDQVVSIFLCQLLTPSSRGRPAGCWGPVGGTEETKLFGAERFLSQLSNCCAFQGFNRGSEGWESVDTLSKQDLGQHFLQTSEGGPLRSERRRAQLRAPGRWVPICRRPGAVRPARGCAWSCCILHGDAWAHSLSHTGQGTKLTY